LRRRSRSHHCSRTIARMVARRGVDRPEYREGPNRYCQQLRIFVRYCVLALPYTSHT
jgi:hypothetical protein